MGLKKSKLANDQQTVKDHTALGFYQIQNICQHTNLIDKEVCRQHDQFLKICQDGKMGKEQFTTILQDIWPTGNVQNFSNYLFNLCDKNQRGFIEFSEFIILMCQLNDGKSYLGFLFDMYDTRHRGSLPRANIESLFGSMFELIGNPTDEQSGANISQQNIAHLIQTVDESKSKVLRRNQFINIENVNWTDEHNGIGTLLVEYPC